MAKSKKKTETPPEPKPDELTYRQQVWVNAMARTGCLKRSAELADLGYSHSRQLNTCPEYAHVQKALAVAMEVVCEAAIKESAWDKVRLVKDLAEIGDAAIAAGNYRSAVQSRAEIGKLLGLYVQKHEHSGKLTLSELIASVNLEDK